MIIPSRAIYDNTRALNYSGAKEILKSPAHYQSYLAQERVESKALRVGSYIHCAVLQPGLMAQNFVAAPEFDRRTKDGKEAYAAFAASILPGMTVVSSEEAAECATIAAAAQATLDRMGVTFDSTELMFATDYCGTPLKCAIDGVAGDYLWDLKTTEDASPSGILKAVRAYRYHLQAYFYRVCYEAEFARPIRGFRFLFIEKSAPYATAVVEIGPELMSYAVGDFERAYKAYRDCTDSGEWPAYGDGIQVIDTKPFIAPVPIQFA